jgi:peptidoglycan/xylan/chitin deacetylase (PgdA/CDA1 family)
VTILAYLLLGLALLGSALTALPTLVVEWARRESPEVVFQVDTRAPFVALTIDDGPSSATPEILEVLREFGVHATFFVVGEHVADHPELTRRLVAEGHELGHHMMVDAPSIDLSPEAFRRRFREMDRVLDGLGGSRVFRPASGWYDARMVREAASLGYRTVLGSVYPFDAQLPSPGFASWYVRRRSSPGAILVLHDGPERGRRTAQVLRSVLADLRDRGYGVVPVSELVDRAVGSEPDGSGIRRSAGG